jgi:hypothetical protein
MRKAELDKVLYVVHAYIGKFPERNQTDVGFTSVLPSTRNN